MKFIKMLLMIVGALAMGFTILNCIYWLILYTKIGSYILGLLYIGLFYGIYKIITLGMPK